MPYEKVKEEKRQQEEEQGHHHDHSAIAGDVMRSNQRSCQAFIKKDPLKYQVCQKAFDSAKARWKAGNPQSVIQSSSALPVLIGLQEETNGYMIDRWNTEDDETYDLDREMEDDDGPDREGYEYDIEYDLGEVY